MRKVRVKSFSLDSELILELEKFSFTCFGGNSSKAVSASLRNFIPTFQREREELRGKFENLLTPIPEQEERNRLEEEEQKKRLQEQEKSVLEQQRKRKEEESKRKEEEKVTQLKSDPNYQLWYKHYREIRTNPNHDPYTCWYCQYFPDLKSILTEY